MSKTITQLTETTTIETDDVLHVVDVENNQDKKIKAASLWSKKPFGELYYFGASAQTTIAAGNTEYSITAGAALTTTAGILNKFTHDAATGKLTYTGEEDVNVLILYNISGYIASGATAEIKNMMYLNGARINHGYAEGVWTVAAGAEETQCFSTLVTLSKDDYLQPYVNNKTGTENLQISFLNVTITTL